MKIRVGFVSNSSSTSFLFGFLGVDIENLFSAMREHRETFALTDNDGVCCNVENVIESIKSKKIIYSKKDEYYDDPVILPISEVIKRFQCYVKQYKEDDVETAELDNFVSNKNIVYKLQKADKLGIKKVLCIEFGDHHGHIRGGVVGQCMDYEGREIDLLADNLMVVTENMH